MANPKDAGPGEKLRAAWRRLAPLPGGKRLFSFFFGRGVPYSGSIAPLVDLLEPGHARVLLRDRRAVRNHLRSIHAIALVNAGEMCTGLAISLAMGPDARAILTGVSIEYLKKARGTIAAECRCPASVPTEKREWELEGVLTDASGDVVARTKARWLVAPAG